MQPRILVRLAIIACSLAVVFVVLAKSYDRSELAAPACAVAAGGAE